MRAKVQIRERPPEFTLDPQHFLSRGLVFAGLSRVTGSTHYRDSSPYGNHGTLTNMAVPATATSGWAWHNYLRRWAQKFDGSNDYISFPANVFHGLGDFSVALWAQTADADNRYFFFNSGNLQVAMESNGAAATVKFYHGGNAGWTWPTDVLLHHWTLVRRGAITTCYRDGVADAVNTVNYATALDTNATAGSIGCRDGDYYMLGSISDFVVHNRALALPEIQSLADPSNFMLSGLIPPPMRRLFAAAVAAPTAYTLDCATGEYTATGSAASLLVSRKLSAATGEYTATGTAALLLASRKLAAATGEYTATGSAANLLASRKLACDTGDYRATGSAASLLTSRKLSCATGEYTAAGTAAKLLVSRVLAAATGAYTATATPASLIASRKLAAATGEYTATGTNASLLASRKLACATGEYTATGSNATLTWTPVGGGGAYGAIAYVHRRRRR